MCLECQLASYAIQRVAGEGNLTSIRHIISPGTLPTPLKAGSIAAIVELNATNSQTLEWRRHRTYVKTSRALKVESFNVRSETKINPREGILFPLEALTFGSPSVRLHHVISHHIRTYGEHFHSKCTKSLITNEVRAIMYTLEQSIRGVTLEISLTCAHLSQLHQTDRHLSDTRP